MSTPESRFTHGFHARTMPACERLIRSGTLSQRAFTPVARWHPEALPEHATEVSDVAESPAVRDLADRTRLQHRGDQIATTPLQTFSPHPLHEWPWSLCAFGATELRCMGAAIALGGHVRVGFENNLFNPDGSSDVR